MLGSEVENVFLRQQGSLEGPERGEVDKDSLALATSLSCLHDHWQKWCGSDVTQTSRRVGHTTLMILS